MLHPCRPYVYVAGDYMIEVKVMAYDNPTNGAADFNGGCCDFEAKTNCTGIPDEFCDNFFIYCLRPFNTPASLRGCTEGLPMNTSSPVNNDAFIYFIDPLFLIYLTHYY